MSIRLRLFLVLMLVIGVGFYGLLNWLLDDVRPRYLEAMEEGMIDTATVLAAAAADDFRDGRFQGEAWRQTFERAQRREFAAKIYDVTKTCINMRVYITDADGVVVFDSDDGRDEGKDYSRWNDVARTLSGRYGARATRIKADDPRSLVLYVAAPIVVEDQMVGVLTVAKPADSIRLFLALARRKIIVVGLLAAVVVALFGYILSAWITRPLRRLTAYARAVRDGRRPVLPELGRNEVGELGRAYEEMRDALEGKQYVEKYVQTLTHEMKSPLSTINGAAELLAEPMPDEQRQRFLHNIGSETRRLQCLVDRLLELAAVEGRKTLRDIEDVDLGSLLQDLLATMQPQFETRKLQVAVVGADAVRVCAEKFLVRQAMANLLQNAIDFATSGSAVTVAFAREDRMAVIDVINMGAPIPDFALPRVFERFYSLPRPESGRKSTGLGLTFVREVAVLHGGDVRLENLNGDRVRARLQLPAAD